MKKKRILVSSDIHSGDRAGFALPKWQSAICGDKYYRIQKENHEEFHTKFIENRPYDIHFCMGDMIAGKGKRSGGSELTIPTISKQIDATVDFFKYIDPNAEMVHRCVYGTPYHVSDSGEDAENEVVKLLKAQGYNIKVEDHAWVEIYGVMFDLKHKINNAEMYKSTPLTKEKLSNMLWAEFDGQPLADIIIRGHVHNAFHCWTPTWSGFTCPALQAAATKFGGRQCKWPVHWGFLVFDVWEDSSWRWYPHIAVVESQKARSEKL